MSTQVPQASSDISSGVSRDRALIDQYERRVKDLFKIPASRAGQTLGVSRTSWHEYRSTGRLPAYVRQSLRAHARLSDFELETLIEQEKQA